MHSAQRILLAVSCLLCFAFFKYLWDQESVAQASSLGAATPVGPNKQTTALGGYPGSRCSDFDGLEDLAIILKTGSTEIYAKLPIHFQTTFRCTNDYLIYSNVAQDVAGVPIRDAMALVSETIHLRLLAAKGAMLPDWDNLSNDWRFSAEKEETYDIAVETA